MKKRFTFFDVLRGLAVLWMIQVHITNVFLDPALRSGSFFQLLNISNGFVAPAFIFCAGGGLWIALSRKGADYLQFKPALWDYTRRLLYVLFWAFMLHIPAFSFRAMMEMTSTELLWGLQVDVLQTIVYGMFFGLATFFVVRDMRRFTIVMGILAAAVSAGTVFLWNAGPYEILPPAIAVMFTPASVLNSSTLNSSTLSLPYSPFPLLPWLAYMFAGASVMGVFMTSQNKRRTAWKFVAFGVVVPFILFFVKGLDIDSPWSDVWWQASPGGQLFRVCGILLFFGGLYLIDDWLGARRVGKVMQKIGQESLLLYISHLLLVYGNGPIITQAAFGFDQTGALGIVLIWLAVTVPLVLFSLWWNKFKKQYPKRAKLALTIQIVWMVGSVLALPT